MSPGVDHQLAHLGTTVIAFANNSYQFIELRHFALPPGAAASDRELLAALIGSHGYRGTLVPTGGTDLAVHGPYRAAAITADSFVPVSAADAESWLRTWAEYSAALPDPVRADVEREVYPRLASATNVFQLPALPADARETEWRLGLGNSAGFHEFVAIDRTANALTVVVATDD